MASDRFTLGAVQRAAMQAVFGAYSTRMYLDVTGEVILPASSFSGVNQRLFPSSLMLRRVKFLSA